MKELGRRLVTQEGLPKFEPIDLTLDMLLAEGARRGAGGGVGHGLAGAAAGGPWRLRLGGSACPAALPAGAHARAARACPAAALLAAGDRLVQEQEYVNTIQLSDEYLKKQRSSGRSLIGMQG